MKKTILMNVKEPSDKELSTLMHEVAFEVKIKAAQAKKQLNETIANEIANARVKLHAMKV
jgi:hypothetical protein